MDNATQKPVNIRPEALLLALPCAGTEASRPNLHGILLEARGFVVATNGHIMSCYRNGWDHEIGGEKSPPVRAGKWQLHGNAAALRKVAQAALRDGVDVVLMPQGDTWVATALVARKPPAPVLVTLERDGDGFSKYPESWQQVIPEGDKVEPCLVSVDGEYLGVMGKAVSQARNGHTGGLKMYTVAPRRAIVLRGVDLPDWVGLVMPLMSDHYPAWDLETSSDFLGTHGKGRKVEPVEAAA